jgi:uncharacterized protein YndB with AHSA1/START domain
MGAFAIERIVAAPPAQVWDVITDWASYPRWMPLTTMRLDRGPTGTGWSFTAVTGVGRLHFCDVMRITQWAPAADAGPGAFRLVKVGPLLAGWAEVSVSPVAGGEQTRLLWRENIVIRPILLGRLLAPLSDRFSKALFTRVVEAMAAEAVSLPGRDDHGQNGSGRQ